MPVQPPIVVWHSRASAVAQLAARLTNIGLQLPELLSEVFECDNVPKSLAVILIKTG